MSKKYKTSLIISFLLMVIALILWAVQIHYGLILTNLSNLFSWGFYISGLAFFVGNAAGGLVLSASIYMLGLKELKAFARLGALSAFACVTGAMLIVLPDIGQPLRLLNLLLHPQFLSPLIWDVIVLNCYTLLTLTYFYILILPDLTGKLSFLAPKKISDPKAFSEKWARRLSPLALFSAASIHIVTAWIFSTQGSREWWFTAILAPDFLSVAVFAGTTVVLLASALLYGTGEEHTAAYKIMVKIILGALILHLFFMYNEIFIKSWYHAESALHVLKILFQDYLWLHLIEVIFPVVAVYLLFKESVLQSQKKLVATTILLLLGVFAHRYLLMPGAYNAVPLSFLPLGQQAIGPAWSYPIALGRSAANGDLFSAHWAYYPSLVEVGIFIGICAYVFFFIACVCKLLPVLTPTAAAAATTTTTTTTITKSAQ
ncbi:MAG: polysulfide reductase NrfD [Oligoflexia bacterium]|nr:polysulfide reductase NrfD [Oligoflexia bacterium]